MISIIMPVKNAIPYLKDCIQSIIDQSYQNWELIAVNDHSEDLSYEVLNQFAHKDGRIQVLHNNGRGIIDALDSGYNQSKGTYITRMDADDLMPPKKLETLLNHLVESGKGFVATGKVKYISETVLGNGFKKYEGWLNHLCLHNTQYKEIYRECVIPSPCWMIHRDDFEAIGGFDNATYPEDYDLCFRMYQHNIKVLSANTVLHIWRDHGERASRNDSNYSDNRFLDLKVNYFLKIDHSNEVPLIIWGAGKKGKNICKILVEKEVLFTWITNNENKIGKDIYGIKLKSPEVLRTILHNPTIIIAVANEDEQNDIMLSIKKSDVNPKIFKFC